MICYPLMLSDFDVSLTVTVPYRLEVVGLRSSLCVSSLESEIYRDRKWTYTNKYIYLYIYIYIYTLTKIINATLLFLPLFFMSWTQRSNNFSMYTKRLFLSNICSQICLNLCK